MRLFLWVLPLFFAIIIHFSFLPYEETSYTSAWVRIFGIEEDLNWIYFASVKTRSKDSKISKPILIPIKDDKFFTVNVTEEIVQLTLLAMKKEKFLKLNNQEISDKFSGVYTLNLSPPPNFSRSKQNNFFPIETSYQIKWDQGKMVGEKVEYTSPNIQFVGVKEYPQIKFFLHYYIHYRWSKETSCKLLEVEGEEPFSFYMGEKVWDLKLIATDAKRFDPQKLNLALQNPNWAPDISIAELPIPKHIVPVNSRPLESVYQIQFQDYDLKVGFRQHPTPMDFSFFFRPEVYCSLVVIGGIVCLDIIRWFIRRRENVESPESRPKGPEVNS